MNVLERIKNGETEVMLLDITEFNGITGKVQSEEEDKEELIRLAEIGQRMQWISVDDRLPDDGDYNIMVYNSDPCNKRPIVMHVYDFLKHRCNSITHWMALPDQPNREDNQ